MYSYRCCHLSGKIEKGTSKKKSQQYAAKRAYYYRQERARIIEYFRNRVHRGEPAENLLGKLAFWLEINDGNTGEWYSDYCQIKSELEAYEKQNRSRKTASNSYKENDNSDRAAHLGQVEFNGIWMNLYQGIFLAHTPALEYEGEELLDFLAFLAESESMFAEFANRERSARYCATHMGQARTPHAAENGGNLAAYYRIFGLTPETLTAESLKKSYRELCLKYHPDKNKAPNAGDRLVKVQKVYEVLKQELARKNA